MRKLVTTLAMAGLMGFGAAAGANAAPVGGFDTLYNAVFSGCTLPAGTLEICESAINAYSGALVGGVDIAEANASFTALRAEVFAANAADEVFQGQIDALFELLLPDSGALPGSPSPTIPG